MQDEKTRRAIQYTRCLKDVRLSRAGRLNVYVAGILILHNHRGILARWSSQSEAKGQRGECRCGDRATMASERRHGIHT